MRYLTICFLSILFSWHVSAEISVRAEYHAPTNLFFLMDETVLWNPGFNDRAYRKAWTERFGWSEIDRASARRYKRYRKRTFDSSDQLGQKGLFLTRTSASLEAYPLAQHFISSSSIEDALSTLETITSAEDAHMLRSFYEQFRPQWQVLLDESKAFVSKADALNGELTGDQIDSYLARMSAFYGVDEDIEFKVHFVWWPPIGRTIAQLRGQALLLHGNPVHHADETDLAGIAMHEAVHYVSAHQPSEQKNALSEQFFKICPAKAKNLYHLLEEPLAVAWGQAAFAKYGKGQPLNPSGNWYRPPMPDVMGRLLWLHVDAIYETDATIADGMIVEAAGYCARILDIDKTVKRRRGVLGWLSG